MWASVARYHERLGTTPLKVDISPLGNPQELISRQIRDINDTDTGTRGDTPLQACLGLIHTLTKVVRVFNSQPARVKVKPWNVTGIPSVGD
jgi:hypothetical protein